MYVQADINSCTPDGCLASTSDLEVPVLPSASTAPPVQPTQQPPAAPRRQPSLQEWASLQIDSPPVPSLSPSAAQSHLLQSEQLHQLQKPQAYQPHLLQSCTPCVPQIAWFHNTQSQVVQSDMSQSQFSELQMQINQSQKPLSCMPQCQVPYSCVPWSQSQLSQSQMPRSQMPQSCMPQMSQSQMPQICMPQMLMPQMFQIQKPQSQMPWSQTPQSSMPQMPQSQMSQFSMPQSCKPQSCMPQVCMPQLPLSQMPQSQLAHLQMQIHQSQRSQCLTTTASNSVSDTVSNTCDLSQQLHKRTLLMSDREQVQVAPVHKSVDQMHRLSDHNESAYFNSRHRHGRLVPSYVSQKKAASKPAQSTWQSASP